MHVQCSSIEAKWLVSSVAYDMSLLYTFDCLKLSLYYCWILVGAHLKMYLPSNPPPPTMYAKDRMLFSFQYKSWLCDFSWDTCQYPHFSLFSITKCSKLIIGALSEFIFCSWRQLLCLWGQEKLPQGHHLLALKQHKNRQPQGRKLDSSS